MCLLNKAWNEATGMSKFHLWEAGLCYKDLLLEIVVQQNLLRNLQNTRNLAIC